MHLTEILAARTQPAAGITLGLTRRCPLHCAHCSTASTMASLQAPADLFGRFVDTFTEQDHPRFLAMSGGEVMLRPRLVAELANRARTVGTRTMALSGMFFATEGRVPPAIRRAIASLDHFSVSLDVFHEREVPRVGVFTALKTLLAEGTDVSIHLCGLDADDPYLSDVTEDVQATFEGEVPMFVNSVSSFGRATEWLEVPRRQSPPGEVVADPCGSAAWPLVSFDGSVVACGNDDIDAAHPPAHLRLGHIGRDDWPTIRARCQRAPMVRALHLLGPEYLAKHHGSNGASSAGYCGTCRELSRDADLTARVAAVMTRPSTLVMEAAAEVLHERAGAVAFARRHGVPRYAELVTCGATS